MEEEKNMPEEETPAEESDNGVIEMSEEGETEEKEEMEMGDMGEEKEEMEEEEEMKEVKPEKGGFFSRLFGKK